MLYGGLQIMDFTKVFIKLYGFFFVEIYSLLSKNKTEQDKQMELKLLPQYCKINHISEMRVWFENSNLAEKENINSISTKLYNGLKELEKQNISEKESNSKTVAQVLELKNQTEHITFETNEFENISHELCVELKKKIAEMESKYMSEETIKQEQMITILELKKQIESITLEKNKLECIVADLHTELFTSYQGKLDKLVAENMKVPILCKNKEVKNIRDNNSLLYEHECIYKEKMIILTEENKRLLSEFNELSANLMNKIEENDMVKEQCNRIKCKIEQLLTMNLAENSILKIQSPESKSIKYLKAENDTLKAEIAELKERIKVLAEENAQFSNDQLETMGNLDSSCNERSGNTSLRLLTTVDSDADKNKTEYEISNVNTCEILLSKVTTLQDKIDHPTHLNEKLITSQQSELFNSNTIKTNNLQKLNDNLDKYANETLNLTQKLAFLESMKEKFNEMVAEEEHIFHQQKILINDNEKLNKELSDVRKCMINKLKSFKCNENSIDFSNKSVNEIFVVLMQTLVFKEKEVIVTMQEKYERARQKVENEKQQWINVAKCATTMVRELKAEIGRFQTEKESIHADYKDQLHQLKHILRKSINEKKIFKRELYKGIRNGKIELCTHFN